MVMVSPDGGFDVVPDLAFHPLDRIEAERVVRAFVASHMRHSEARPSLDLSQLTAVTEVLAPSR